MKIAAMVLLGLGTAFYLVFALGEAASGEAGGAAHLLPALLLGALMYVAWKRPLAAGIIVLILSVPLGVLYAYLAIGSVGVATGTAWSVQIVLPAWVAGGLLLAVGRRARPLAARAPRIESPSIAPATEPLVTSCVPRGSSDPTRSSC